MNKDAVVDDSRQEIGKTGLLSFLSSVAEQANFSQTPAFGSPNMDAKDMNKQGSEPDQVIKTLNTLQFTQQQLYSVENNVSTGDAAFFETTS